MRILPVAVTVSVVVHTVALAWVDGRKLERPPVLAPGLPAPAETVAPPAIESEPPAVALLDDHTVTALHATPATAAPENPTRAGNPIARTAIETTTGRPRTETPSGPGPATKAAPPPRSGLMTMRPPAAPEARGMSEDFIESFLAHSKPLQPNPIEGQRIEDEIHAADANLHSAGWMANHSGDEVADERAKLIAAREARDAHELKQKGDGYEADHATFKGEVEPDGTIHIHEKRRYDPTEILMTEVGIDPYAANKRRMLDNTREERFQLGKAYKARQLGRSAQLAQQNLNDLWARITGVAARKEALFELWDECEEPADDAAPELIAGAASARAVILGFIKGRMTGAAAYTPAELAAFNAKRKSHAEFDPYSE